MKPIFSIITPTYNRVDNLKKLSKHLLSQKKREFLEWVIVVEKDDFATIKFLKTIKIKKRIILNSGGLQNAFKNGAKKATGKYISFLGDDDFLKKNIFEILLDKIKVENPVWIIGYGSYINPEGKKIRKNTTKIKNFLLRNFNKVTLLLVDYIMTPSSFCQKKYLEKVGFFRNIHWYGNDYICWIQLSKIIKPMIIKQTLSYASHSKSTLTGSFNYRRFISLYLNVSKESNNLFINILQFFIVIYILFHNLILKKVL